MKYTPTSLILIVVGIITIHVAKSRLLFEGPKRADNPTLVVSDHLTLTENVLPNSISKWRSAGFRSPSTIADEATHQTWSSHIWRFRNAHLQALVALDQEDWKEWHELSCCYQAKGWQLTDRINSRGEGNWQYVISKFENQASTQSGILMFSLFRQDGTPIIPAAWSAKALVGILDGDFVPKLGVRIRGQPRDGDGDGDGRIFQCQVFVTHSGKLTASLQKEIAELHTVSREKFREECRETALRK